MLSLENVKHYFSSRPYYIGQVKQAKFKRFVYLSEERGGEELPMGGDPTPVSISRDMKKEEQVTSAFVFDYDMLNCELERGAGDADVEL